MTVSGDASLLQGFGPGSGLEHTWSALKKAGNGAWGTKAQCRPRLVLAEKERQRRKEEEEVHMELRTQATRLAAESGAQAPTEPCAGVPEPTAEE